MKIEADHPVTGEKIVSDLTDEQASELNKLGSGNVSDKKLNGFLDELNMSKETSALMEELKNLSIKLDDKTIEIGRRILDMVIDLQSQFPYTTFGLILSLVISILITAIPVLGSILGGILTPILIALGMAVGLNEDLKDNDVYKKFSEINARIDAWMPSLNSTRQFLDNLTRPFASQS